MAESSVHELKIVVGIEYIEYGNRLLIGDVRAAESYELVEDREGVTHTAVCLLRNDVEGILGDGDAFVRGHRLQVRDGVGDSDAIEVIDLASAEDGRQNLMLLRGSEDEDRVPSRRKVSPLKGSEPAHRRRAQGPRRIRREGPRRGMRALLQPLTIAGE